MQVTREARHGPLIVANPAFGEPLAASPAADSGAPPAVRVSSGGRDLGARSVGAYFAPIAGTAREGLAIRRLFPDATVLAGERASNRR